jgi:hypothetical protein
MKELKAILLRVAIIIFILSGLYLTAHPRAQEQSMREKCYQSGVANLPQGVDQTLLQKESQVYQECLKNK